MPTSLEFRELFLEYSKLKFLKDICQEKIDELLKMKKKLLKLLTLSLRTQ